MIPTFDLQPLASVFVERMLNSTVEGIGIVLFAWLLLRIFSKQNSGTRFVVWLSALASIAALPLVERISGHVAFQGQAPISLSVAWAPYLFGAWAFLALIGLARVCVGFSQVLKLKKSCKPLSTADLDPCLRHSLQEFASTRPVTLCVSDLVRMPAAIGFLEPVVVIPTWAIKELSITELNSILLHELAHIRRWDDYTNLAQQVLTAIFFFHPAVWWVHGRLALEREMACDDLVLARTGSPKAYAQCLISLAEKGLLRKGLALAQAAVSRMHHTSLRVTQILDRSRPRATRVWMPALGLLGGFAVSAVIAMPYLPRLVAFTNPVADTQTAQTAQGDGADFYAPRAVPSKLSITPAAETPHAPARVVKPVRAKTASPPVRRNLPLVVETRGTTEIAAPAAVFVVMRTETADSSAWTVCIWRVTWITPQHKKLNAGGVAKST